MGVEIITLLTVALLFVAIRHFFTNNDEFLFIPVLFFFAAGINRYNAVIEEKTEWVVVAYARQIFNLTNELGLEALSLFFLGTLVFAFSYLIYSKKMNRPVKIIDNKNLLKLFMLKNQKIIIGILIFFIFVNSVVNRALVGIESMAYGYSYLFLFKLAIGGIVLLVFVMFQQVTFKYHFSQKVVYFVLLLLAAYASYNPTTRFQFLSWMVAIGIIYVKNMQTTKKFALYSVGGFAVIVFFSYAGNTRHSNLEKYDFFTQIDLAIERLTVTEDLNMLDGFMMVMQVYPEHLDYHYGGEHLEILLRPIPRVLWPDKPVGGYANKLGLNDNMKGATVGISQSLYGSFYGEGGVLGIILFSIFYGWLFNYFFRFSKRYGSEVRFLLKGLIIASSIPLLRGGDLPGIIAFVGMSYWPVFLFLYMYNRFLKEYELSQFLQQRKKQLATAYQELSESKT